MSQAVDKLLLLAPRWPVPALRGYERRTIELVRALRDRCEVHVVCFATPDAAPLGVDDVPVRVVRRGALTALAGNLAAPDPRIPAQVRLYLDRRMHAAVREEVAAFRPDVVCAVLARMAPYLAHAGAAHRHVDLIDALSLNMLRRAGASSPPARAALTAEGRLMRAYEERVVARADSSSLVAEADRAAAPWLASSAVVPMGVDLEGMPYRSPVEREPVLLFFGNLGYFPNVESARVAAEEVLPRVRRAVPGATLRVVGARPTPAVQALDALEGVTVVGPVDRMADALHGAAVAVVPVYSGSGMKTKVTEAMAAGTPVVANAMALEGIPEARSGTEHLQSESYDELAADCVRLLTDAAERERLAVAARAMVERAYAWSARADDLLRLWQR